MRSIFALLLVLGCASGVHAKQVLRLATVAPEGTSWARQLNSLADEVEAATHGELKDQILLGRHGR